MVMAGLGTHMHGVHWSACGLMGLTILKNTDFSPFILGAEHLKAGSVLFVPCMLPILRPPKPIFYF